MKKLDIAYVFYKDKVNEVIASINSVLYMNPDIDIVIHLISDIDIITRKHLMRKYEGVCFYRIFDICPNEYGINTAAYIKLHLCEITACKRVLYINGSIICNCSLEYFAEAECCVALEELDGTLNFDIMLLYDFKADIPASGFGGSRKSDDVLRIVAGHLFKAYASNVHKVMYQDDTDFLYEGYFYKFTKPIKPYMPFFKEIYGDNNLAANHYRKFYKPVKEELSETLPIGGVADEAYVLKYITAFSSLLDHLSKNKMVMLRLLCREVSDETKSLTKKYFHTYYKNIDFEMTDMTDDMKELVSGFPEDRRGESAAHVTNTTLCKPFLGEVFKEFNKFLYLDGDVLVNGDVSFLMKLDIRGYYWGAAFKNDHQKTEKQTGILKYFNAGVMVFNNHYINAYSFWEKYLSWIESFRNSEFTEGDQLILNKIANGAWLDFGRKYNSCVHRRMGKGLDDAVIYHYTSRDKPWNDSESRHKYFNLYNEYNKKIMKRLEKIKNE